MRNIFYARCSLIPSDMLVSTIQGLAEYLSDYTSGPAS
jgi:hypothetical protein